MTTPLPVGPLSPYVTPELLTQAPTGISWSSIPPGGTRLGVNDKQRLAEQSNICARSTALVDKACKQPLRATIDTVELYAPGVRAGVPRDCLKPATLIMTRWPVLAVVDVRISRNVFPRAFTSVPAGLYAPKRPVVGLYGSVAPAAAGEGGQAVSLAAGYLNWLYGHEGYVVEVDYINGWPHTALTSQVVPVTSGAQEIEVDDCTGWAITSAVGGVVGATGTVYDAAGQEVIHVTSASATSGPGTLTLAAPLQADHAAGVMVSTLPQSAVWAAILFCCDIALQRGATSTTVQELPGKKVAEAAGITANGGTPSDWACKILQGTFDRII
jgi:hypothetical protein